MNILLDDLPEAVMVGGVAREINSDFRTCVRIILAFEDEELTAYEKQAVLLMNLYRGAAPDDTAEAVVQGIRFLDCGRTPDAEGAEDALRLYSFATDANLIYAAFRQTHRVDLQRDAVHWWEFVALFFDLGSDTVFCSLTGLRERVLTGKATKDEKALYEKLGDTARLPEHDARTHEERQRDAEKEAEFEAEESRFMGRLGKGRV